jgi:glutathione S-transferase
MTRKVYGHPWSINTRKTLMTLAEKGHEAELAVVMLPTGEHKTSAHLARHPFAKVPVLEDDGFFVYESRAISAYLDRTLGGPALTPEDARGRARVDQWIGVADAYFAPHAGPLIVETLFRPYLGGDPDRAAIAAGREGMQVALDVVDRALASNDYLAGTAFSLADIHWMPYLEYLAQIGEGEAIERRKNLAAWWKRTSSRPAWVKVARTGPQPYDPVTRAEVLARLGRG